MSLVRAAGIADLDAISALERSLFGLDAWSPRSIEQELTALGPARLVLVAIDGAEVVGYAVVSVAGDVADLRRVAVAPAYQRRGIAARLVGALLTESRELGCGRMLLEVAADNAAASALYRRQGFAEIARRRGYYEDGMDAIVMERAVGGVGR